ncbi:MAG: DUF1572 family protein [Fibrobacteria bacterium]|nr:DUF1572 family protein [Fibrobacteria bacterium]
MNAIIDHLRALLLRDLDAFSREIAAFPDDTSPWERVPGFPNSAGNLALHVAGNLLHFIGSQLGGTDYHRDRDLEFRRDSGTRGEILEDLGKARSIVDTILPRLDEQKIQAPYPLPFEGQTLTTGAFLLRLGVHLGYHLGQASVIRRTLAAD